MVIQYKEEQETMVEILHGQGRSHVTTETPRQFLSTARHYGARDVSLEEAVKMFNTWFRKRTNPQSPDYMRAVIINREVSRDEDKGEFEDEIGCADCIFWDREGDSSWGHCENEKAYTMTDPNMIATQQNFGCKFFQER